MAYSKILSMTLVVAFVIAASAFVHHQFDVQVLTGVGSNGLLLAEPGQPTLKYRISRCMYQGFDGRKNTIENTAPRCTPICVLRRGQDQ